LVRVRLERTPSTGAASVHDYLYEVDRIGKSISGEVRLELTHFPVDADFASVVAQEVDAAVGAGFVLPTGLSGITCDVNSSTDTTVPADTSLDPDDWDLPDDGDFDTDVTEVPPVDFPGVSGGVSGGGGGGGGDPTRGNPPDPLNPQDDPQPVDPYPDWPEPYIRPDDPAWPPEIPTNTDPDSGAPYIEPAPPLGDAYSSPQPAGYVTRIASSGNLVYFPSPSTCANGSPTSNSPTITDYNFTGKYVRGIFRETGGPDDTCGNPRYALTWVVFSDGTISSALVGGAGGDRPNGGWVFTWPTATITHVIP
jgi:hypothetical protein